MRIGILGTELLSINYGCAALGIAQIQFIENIAKAKKTKIEYYVFSNDEVLRIEKLKKQLNIESKIEIKKLINFRDGIKGMSYILDEINKCDFIIDITYGDSFSDIYGFKNYILYTIPKLMTLYRKKILVLAPQTVGPYKNKLAKLLSKKVLKKSNIICVRDEKSLEYAKKISKREDIILASDLAMELPYEKQKLNGTKFKVGINISTLLWNNSNEENLKQYGIVVDYKELVKKIITKFTSEKYEIHLITHVYAKDDSKGEYALAKKVHEEFPETILAPKFESPIDAKSYMSGLDLFFRCKNACNYWSIFFRSTCNSNII